MSRDIIGLIIFIMFALLLFACLLFVYHIDDLRIKSMRKYISTLNEHDKAVITDYEIAKKVILYKRNKKMKDNRLMLVGGDMVLHFNRPLTENEKHRLTKAYKKLGWCLFYYDEAQCEIAFQRAVVDDVKLPKHEDD